MRMMAAKDGQSSPHSNSNATTPEPDMQSANGDAIASRGLSGSRAVKTKAKPMFSMNTLEECRLTAFISLISRSGKCLSYTEIKGIAEHVKRSSSQGKPTIRSKLCPSNNWLHKFRARHHELSYRTPDHPSMKPGDPTKSDMTSWYQDLEKFLKLDWKIDLLPFFTEENSSRIYTCDEILIAFSKVDEKGDKVPLKSMLNSTSEDEKQLVTVIAAASASGDYVQPCLLLPDISIDSSKFPTLDTTSFCSVPSSNGLVTSDLFLQWIQNFDAHLTAKDIKRPVVLLMDDHAAHFHISVFLYCLDKQIVPVCLPPRLNKLLQPLLGSFFPKLMMAYQACCKRYTSKTGEAISHACFPYVIMKAWTLVTKPKFVVEGFKTCRLLPMSVSEFDLPDPPPVENTEKPIEAISNIKIKTEDTGRPSEDGESSVQMDDASLNGDVPTPSAKPVKSNKKRKISKSPPVTSTNGTSSTNSPSTSVLLGDKFVSEDRREGRREGINICLSVLESFIPADILPVWQGRAPDHSGTCEIGYCMWKAVQLLKEGGVDMAGQTQPQTLLSSQSSKTQ